MILIGELSLWVALLMAAWSVTVSFAGARLRRDELVDSGVRTVRDVRDGAARIDRTVDRASDERLFARVCRRQNQLDDAERVHLHRVLERAGGIASLLGADLVRLFGDRDRD